MLDAANRPIDLPPPPDAVLRIQLDEAADSWSLFRTQLVAPRSIELQATSTHLIDQLDQVIHAYETRAQAKLTQLQMLQAIFLIAAVALLAGGCYVVRAQLLQPLNALGVATQRMAQGDLSQPATVMRHDELGELAQAFDTIRSEIAAAHDESETRVDQRTQELTSAFEFSQEINAQLEIEELLQSVTDRARHSRSQHGGAVQYQRVVCVERRRDSELHQQYQRFIDNGQLRAEPVATREGPSASCLVELTPILSGGI